MYLNISCRTLTSYIRPNWVIMYLNESCQTLMSHIRPNWIIMNVNESCWTLMGQIRRYWSIIYLNGSCWTLIVVSVEKPSKLLSVEIPSKTPNGQLRLTKFRQKYLAIMWLFEWNYQSKVCFSIKLSLSRKAVETLSKTKNFYGNIRLKCPFVL